MSDFRTTRAVAIRDWPARASLHMRPINITSRVTQIVQLLKIIFVSPRVTPSVHFTFRWGREESKSIERFQCGDLV